MRIYPTVLIFLSFVLIGTTSLWAAMGDRDFLLLDLQWMETHVPGMRSNPVLPEPETLEEEITLNMRQISPKNLSSFLKNHADSSSLKIEGIDESGFEMLMQVLTELHDEGCKFEQLKKLCFTSGNFSIEERLPALKEKFSLISLNLRDFFTIIAE